MCGTARMSKVVAGSGGGEVVMKGRRRADGRGGEN